MVGKLYTLVICHKSVNILDSIKQWISLNHQRWSDYSKKNGSYSTRRKNGIVLEYFKLFSDS